MKPEDVQTIDELSIRWKETAFKRDALFSAVFHGSAEYWNRSQTTLNGLKTDREEIRQELNELLEQYFPHLDK